MTGARVLLVAALAAFAPSAAFADHAPAPAQAAEPAAKKDRERAAKSARHPAPPKPGRRPARLINLYNQWTHEWLAVEPGVTPAAALVNWFLRDHYTNQPTRMEPRLLAMVIAAATHFRSDVAHVVSAFRHPKYNLILRKKGHQVARDSHHTLGDAIDFYLPRVTTQKLHAWARDQKVGGVGLYLDSGFIHMDTGKIRLWSGE